MNNSKCKDHGLTFPAIRSRPTYYSERFILNTLNLLSSSLWMLDQAWDLWYSGILCSLDWQLVADFSGQLKYDSHIACRSPDMPCHLGFRMRLSHLIHAVWPCLIHTYHAMLRTCRSSQGHSTARPSRDGRAVLWLIGPIFKDQGRRLFDPWEIDRLSRNVGNCDSKLRNITEEGRYLVDSGSLKSLMDQASYPHKTGQHVCSMRFDMKVEIYMYGMLKS